MDDPDKQVGRQIERLRTARNMNQAQFAALISKGELKWSQRTVSRLESGERALKYTEAFALAAALDLAPEEVAPPALSVDHHYRHQLGELHDAQRKLENARGYVIEERSRARAWKLIFELKQGSTRAYSVHGAPDELAAMLTVRDDSTYMQPDEVPWSAIFGALGVSTEALDDVNRQAQDDTDAILRGDEPSYDYPEGSYSRMIRARDITAPEEVRRDLVIFDCRGYLYEKLLADSMPTVTFDVPDPRPDSIPGEDLLITGIEDPDPDLEARRRDVAAGRAVSRSVP